MQSRLDTFEDVAQVHRKLAALAAQHWQQHLEEPVEQSRAVSGVDAVGLSDPGLGGQLHSDDAGEGAPAVERAVVSCGRAFD